MKGRLAWSDLRVIRDVISVLTTQGWQKSLDEEDCESDNEDTEKVDPLEPMERLRVQFKIPLESAGVDINKLRDGFYDMVLYATQFIKPGACRPLSCRRRYVCVSAPRLLKTIHVK